MWSRFGHTFTGILKHQTLADEAVANDGYRQFIGGKV